MCNSFSCKWIFHYVLYEKNVPVLNYVRALKQVHRARVRYIKLRLLFATEMFLLLE